MKDASWRGGNELMRGTLGGGSNNVIPIIQHQDGVLLHHVRLRHCRAIPCRQRHDSVLGRN